MNKVKAVSFALLLFSLASTFALAQVTPEALSAATIKRLDRVPEFAYIRELAKRYGIKVYLFGGTAAAFGHYLRWDLEREAGDDKYQPERFDYDFTNIYRGNQDLDIVLDTDSETAKRFRHDLQVNFPHFQGDKESWEVRTLRTSIDDKSPLLNDYDFLNQHTDSNSTGLIDITQLDPSQQAYFDLLDWENSNSKFLNDVANGEITYYHSATHETTSRFKEGKNPPILSAVRYLAKLAQYDVIGRPDDLAQVMQIVSQTNFIELSNYSKEKLTQFSLKALLNSPDVEYAWNLLDDVGLRQKLIDWDKDQIRTEGSLAWWMNKEPLRSFELGQGDGKTAQEFGIDVVSHTTNNFQAYENITRSAQGRANVFISRDQIPGENAAGGPGFYLMPGAVGAKDSGVTVRFHLHPLSRQGKDFSASGANSAVIVQNKNAIRLIQEKISLTLPQYIHLLLNGAIGPNDRGLTAKIERHLARIKPTQEEIQECVRDLQKLPFNDTSLLALNAWLSFPEADKYPEIVNNFFHQIRDDRFMDLISTEFLGTSEKLLLGVLAQPYWVNHPAIIEKALEGRELAVRNMIRYVLSKPWWTQRPDIIQKLIEANNIHFDIEIAQDVLSQPYWVQRPDLVEELIKRAKKYTPNATVGWAVAGGILTKPYWSQHSEFLEQILAENDIYADKTIARSVLAMPFWANKPQYARWVQIILDRIISGRGPNDLLAQFSLGVLDSKYSASHPQWVVDVATKFFTAKDEETNEKRGYNSDTVGWGFFRGALHNSFWAENPVLLSYLNGKSVTIKHILERNEQLPFREWLKEQRKGQDTEISQPENCSEILVGA